MIAQTHFGTSGAIFAHLRIEQSGTEMAPPHTGSSEPYIAQSRIGSTGPTFTQQYFGGNGSEYCSTAR
jgi:hypothetical protein